MWKYVLLIAGSAMVINSFFMLYISYAPRVGPIGEGPNDTLVWVTSVASFIGGSCAVTLSVLLFRQEMKSGNDGA